MSRWVIAIWLASAVILIESLASFHAITHRTIPVASPFEPVETRVLTTPGTRRITTQTPAPESTGQRSHVAVPMLATRVQPPKTETLSPLHVRLLGTSVQSEGSSALALLKDFTTGATDSYPIGARIQGRRLTVIARDHVVLTSSERGDERVDLEAEDSSSSQTSDAPFVDTTAWRPVAEQVFTSSHVIKDDDARTIKTAITRVSETERIVARRTAWQAVKGNPLQVAREAALAPAFQGGHLVGVTLRTVPDDGILQHSGFQSGDVVRTVNGQSMSDPTAILKLTSQLQQTDQVEVTVERNGHPVILHYELR